MARQHRIDYPGAIHHVMNRGARKAPVFANRSVRHLFVKRLRTLPERFNIQLQAWVLMPNHYHLILRSSGTSMSPAMKWLGQTVTQSINTRPDWDGPVFRGRFRNRVVQTERHHAHLFAYLHLNPVPHLASDAHHWPWSSARALLGRTEMPTWLSAEGVQARFGSPDALRAYTDEIRMGRAHAPETFDEDVLWDGPASGLAEKTPADHLLRCVQQLTPGASIVKTEQLAAASLVRVAGLTQAQAAQRLGISRRTVNRAIERHGDALRPGGTLRHVLDGMLTNR